MDKYEDVMEFYDRSWSREEDEPVSWHDLTYEVQSRVKDDYEKYKKEYVEWEQWYYGCPMDYYGVSR
jgi:hypothetical protein